MTSYLEEHPGGEDVLLEVAGQDSTVAFEDVSHSDDAGEMMEHLLVGRIGAASEEDDCEGRHLPLPKTNLSVRPKDHDLNTEAPLITIAKSITEVEGFLKPEEYQKLPLAKK